MISRPLFPGGYPDLHLGVDRDLLFPAYVATYLERDVRNVLRIANLPEFNRFSRACALRTAQAINSQILCGIPASRRIRRANG